MTNRFSRLLLAFFLTLVILIGLEIFSSAILPSLGWMNYKLNFNVLIILFLAFRFATPVFPWIILILQFAHAIFSVEGWALGTLVGILLSILVVYVKEVLHFSSFLLTIITVQIFQTAWYLLSITLICLKLGSFEKFGLYFGNAFISSILLSILSPLLFKFLDKIWAFDDESSHHGVGI
jgi:hypothetical protein